MVARNRRSSEEKIRIVMESLTTDTSIAELRRKYNIQPQTLHQWKEKLIEGGKVALIGRNGNAAKQLQRDNESLKRMEGDLTMANDIFKKTLEDSKR